MLALIIHTTILSQDKISTIENNLNLGMNMSKAKLYKLYEITTDIEGVTSKETIDVNIEDTVITAIKAFKNLFPAKADFITDAQLVSGDGGDDLTLFLLGNESSNVKKAFKIAFNLLSSEQRYAFQRTPDIITIFRQTQSVT